MIYGYLRGHGESIDKDVLMRFTMFCLGGPQYIPTARFYGHYEDLAAAASQNGHAPSAEEQLRWWAQNDPSTFAMMTMANDDEVVLRYTHTKGDWRRDS